MQNSQTLLLVLLTPLITAGHTEGGTVELPPEVQAHMREVHAGFKGQKGYVAQFGDSITYSMAFWSPMSWDDPSTLTYRQSSRPKLGLQVQAPRRRRAGAEIHPSHFRKRP